VSYLTHHISVLRLTKLDAEDIKVELEGAGFDLTRRYMSHATKTGIDYFQFLDSGTAEITDKLHFHNRHIEPRALLDMIGAQHGME